MAKSIISPSDVEVEQITLYTPNGKVFDISDLVIEINIYEDLFSPMLTADMMVVDAAGLFANTPILGQEKITGLILRGDTLEEFEFRCTGVEGITGQNDYTLSYKFNLVEESYYRNCTTLISQSFEGRISDIITTIANDFLDEDIEVEETVGNFKFVIPNWSPYRTIRWLLRRAHNKNNVPMVCYKTLYDGLQLKSLESLFEQSTTHIFYDRKKDIGNQLTDKDQYLAYYQTANELSQNKIGSVSEYLKAGAYGSRTQLVDTMNKHYDIFDYNYKDQFDRTSHLEKAKTISNNFLVNDKSVFDYPSTTQKNFVHSEESFGDSHMDYNGDVLNSSPYLVSYFRTMSFVEYYLMISGRMNIGVGSLIDLKLNKNMPLTSNQMSEVEDKRRSGKHIITGLRHKFDSNRQYNIIINAARDTMGAEYNETI